MKGFVTGECIPFPDKPITKDAVWLALVAQSPECDQLVHQNLILTACFKSRELLLVQVTDSEDQAPAIKAATGS